MKILCYLLILLPAFAHAQYDLTFKDIAGKWVEKTRTDKNNDVAPFKDTLYLELREDGFMLLRHTIGGTNYGTAELKENNLTLDKETYTIESFENDILKLKQKKTTHRFMKEAEFPDAPVAKAAPAMERGVSNNYRELLPGKWSVYKKTDPGFTGKTFYLKSIEIRETKQEDQFTGVVTFHNMDSVYTSEATMKTDRYEMNIFTPNKILKTKVIKNDGNELILEHGNVNYFLKKQGK